MRTSTIVAIFAVTLIPALARADDPEPVSAADVAKVFGRLPAECSLYTGLGSCPRGKPGGFGKSREVAAFSRAIAEQARDLTEAVTAATFVAYESAVDSHKIGDKKSQEGASYGGLQLKEFWVPKADAMDVDKSVRAWLKLKRQSETLCASNPPDARLAAVASGNCAHGWRLVERRMRVVRKIVADLRADRAAAAGMQVAGDQREVGVE